MMGNFAQQSLPLVDSVNLTIRRQDSDESENITVRRHPTHIVT